LNAIADDGLIELFVAEALGSPHLVQEFFRDLCLKSGLQESSDEPIELRPPFTAQALLSEIAKHLSRPVFEALAKGPRQRSDRMQRTFRDGRTGDIYHAVLNAIARLKPSIGLLEYEQIRSSLRDLLTDLPQAHEVSRVLEHMSTIQANDGASAPVLDWDKRNRRLHITDPYFAFFLKWGADVFSRSSNTEIVSIAQERPATAVPSPELGSSGTQKGEQPSVKETTRMNTASVPAQEVPTVGAQATIGVRSILNNNERAVVHSLAAANKPLGLATLAAESFPNLEPAQGNSWARNSVRKLLALGFISKAGQGIYQITTSGAKAIAVDESAS
jgi:hypothetical protein